MEDKKEFKNMHDLLQEECSELDFNKLEEFCREFSIKAVKKFAYQLNEKKFVDKNSSAFMQTSIFALMTYMIDALSSMFVSNLVINESENKKEITKQIQVALTKDLHEYFTRA